MKLVNILNEQKDPLKIHVIYYIIKNLEIVPIIINRIKVTFEEIKTIKLSCKNILTDEKFEIIEYSQSWVEKNSGELFEDYEEAEISYINYLKELDISTILDKQAQDYKNKKIFISIKLEQYKKSHPEFFL